MLAGVAAKGVRFAQDSSTSADEGAGRVTCAVAYAYHCVCRLFRAYRSGSVIAVDVWCLGPT